MSDQTPPDCDSDRETTVPQPGNYQFPLGIFLLLGPLIGVMWVLISAGGVFDVWYQLNPPPARPVELVGVSIYFYQADPYVLGEDGETYFCDVQLTSMDGRSQTACMWIVEAVAADAIQAGCRPGGLKYWSWKKPFGEVVDCTETVTAGEYIGAPEITFIIDGEGELWYWAQENRGNLGLYLFGMVILGLLGGFVAGVLWNPVLAMFGKPEPRKLEALRNWEVKALRWGGRIISVASLLYFSAVVLLNLRFLRLDSLDDALLVMGVIGGGIGLIVAWRWEIAGGALVLLASLAATIRYLAGTSWTDIPGNLSGILLNFIPYLPGLFFLLAGILARATPEAGARDHDID